MDYSKIAGQSSVDMLRFRIRVRMMRPERILEWFELLYADLVLEFDRRRDNGGKPIIRYPVSLRIGTYREMLKVPIFGTSLVIGLGSVGKKVDYSSGFLEFNPAKCYPSEQLEYIYRRIESTPEVSLELVRWDFATDYPLMRDEVSLMRDKRHYTFVVSNGVTEYLGSRNKNGFVKLYDKQKELEAKGESCQEPRTRLEVTFEEEPINRKSSKIEDRDISAVEWPKAVLVPKSSGGEGTFSMMLQAWMGGVPLEKLLACLHRNTRAKYRRMIAEECGALPVPSGFEDCRRNAFAWETRYGGTDAV